MPTVREVFQHPMPFPPSWHFGPPDDPNEPFDQDDDEAPPDDWWYDAHVDRRYD